jgi:hypothetical protein
LLRSLAQLETRCHFAITQRTSDALVQRRALSATHACVGSTSNTQNQHRNAWLTHLQVLQNSLSKPRVNVSHQQISDVVFAMCRVAGAAIMGCHECVTLPMHHMIARWLPSCSIDCLPCNQFLLKPTQCNGSFTDKTERMQLEAEWKVNNLKSTNTKCVINQRCTIVAL